MAPLMALEQVRALPETYTTPLVEMSPPTSSLAMGAVFEMPITPLCVMRIRSTADPTDAPVAKVVPLVSTLTLLKGPAHALLTASTAAQKARRKTDVTMGGV
jgi:hypothetical protein